MPSYQDSNERRSCARIAADSVLLYRAAGMDDFKPCSVLTVSKHALEIVSERSIPVQTVVTLAVNSLRRDEFYHVHGKVEKREYREAGWAHIISMSSPRTGSTTLLHDILSAPRAIPNTNKKSCRKRIYTGLESWGKTISIADNNTNLIKAVA